VAARQARTPEAQAKGWSIAEFNEATGALIREYVWFNGAPIAVIEGGVVYLVRSDWIGRPVFATTTSGTVVWRVSYLPFGGVHVTTGAPIDARFPGQWFQTEAGLYQNWMRDYDPATGRYLQADPLGLVDGASVYGYARQSPLRWTDPTGLNPAAPAIFCAENPALCIAAGRAVAKVCIEGAKIAITAVAGLIFSADEGCGCKDDCPQELPVRGLTRLSDNDPRLRSLDPHSIKDSGAEDLYVNKSGCVYVGPAKNSRGFVGKDAMAYWTGIKL
jgi:RHS repeat-associated protein